MSMFQSLNLPTTTPFELSSCLRALGIKDPSNKQFWYFRQWLTDNSFIKFRFSGRKEFWIHSSQKHLIPERDLNIYTPELFAAKFLPGIPSPMPLQTRIPIEKIMRSRGLRARRSGEYWSIKEPRRAPIRSALPPPKKPNYVKIPKRPFNLWDMLHLNQMARTPENLAWAREELKSRGITKPQGMSRYLAPDSRGKLPATVTGAWEAPSPYAFTTFQFQRYNNAERPSQQEWQSALDWLAHNGFKFDPSWKRWSKAK